MKKHYDLLNLSIKPSKTCINASLAYLKKEGQRANKRRSRRMHKDFFDEFLFDD